jgi:RHS repeat-associated protein
VNGSSSYAYDGDGRRVSKTVSGTTTTFVYDAMGQLAAEYGGTPVSAGRQYVTVDHLGSTRLVTTTTGTVATPPSDYLPFGEELGVTCLNAPDAVKFTGHFRDQESCLDFAEARMMSSAQGRFTSPDEPFADQSEGDPQSWNLFSYVRNNPLNATDPSGRDCIYLDNVSNGTAGVETGLNCSRAGGTYVAGTIDQSSVLYSRSSGQVSYSYTSYSGDRGGTGVISLGQDQGGAFISEMARRATASKQMIAVGALSGPTAVAATYAPAAIAVAGRALMGMGAAAGPISVVFRAAQLAHATRVEPGHNTPLGTVQEIQSAVVAAVEKGSYSVSPGGVVKGTTYIQGVAHEFTGFLKASGDIVFSNIYRK